jgi:hypothetical protein
MSAQQIKFEEIVVARPFILVEHEFSGTTIVDIKSRRATEVGESLKFPLVFARELISGKKAVKAGSEEAKEIAAAVKAAKDAARAAAKAEAASEAAVV